MEVRGRRPSVTMDRPSVGVGGTGEAAGGRSLIEDIRKDDRK